MKTIILAIAAMSASWSSFALDVGEYKGNSVSASVYPVFAGMQAVSLYINGSDKCSGNVIVSVEAGLTDAHGSPGGTCYIRIKQKGGNLLISESSDCGFYHGTACSFDGDSKKVSSTPKEASYYEKKSKEKTAKFMAEVLGTLIEAGSPSRIVINGEYIGDTPMRVDLAQYFEGAISLWIKAMPITIGCTQHEHIYSGRRMPKRMYFDTDLCNH